jgi:hypothetical protein
MAGELIGVALATQEPVRDLVVAAALRTTDHQAHRYPFNNTRAGNGDAPGTWNSRFAVTTWMPSTGTTTPRLEPTTTLT